MAVTNNNYMEKLSRYFRQSVLDSERLSPDLKALESAVKSPSLYISQKKPFSIDSGSIKTGILSAALTDKIFLLAEVPSKVQELPLILMPRVELHSVSVGEVLGSSSRIMTPLITEIKINRHGQLLPGDRPPFIPRNFIAPNDSDQATIANDTVLDTFITQYPYNVSGWSEFIDYCGAMLKACVSEGLDDCFSSPGELWDFPVHENYQCRKDIAIAQLEIPIRAGFHITKVLNAIIDGGKASKLYENFFRQSNTTSGHYSDLTVSISDAKHHYAQMTGEFPLSNNQRNALHYLGGLAEGESLSVNGPPGTGKTTLLRSVVANGWVSSILEGESCEPPVVVAASSSNKAVTGILDSFSRVDENGLTPLLQGRWLPGLSTYGLYARSEKVKPGQAHYPHLIKWGAGVFAELQDENYLQKAKSYFISKFNEWCPSENTQGELEVIAKRLRDVVIRYCRLPEQLLVLTESVSKTQKKCQAEYGGLDNLENLIHDLESKSEMYQQNIDKARSILNEFKELWVSRSFLEEIFSFLPFVKKKWLYKNELMAHKNNIELDSYKDSEVESYILKTVESGKSVLAQITRDLKTSICFRDDFVGLIDQAKALQRKAEFSEVRDVPELNWLSDQLDQTIRFKIFKLATHYWEARWLIDMESYNPNEKKSPERLISDYRRYAKLTPCFVSTFNMLPNFFEISSQEDGHWKSYPLYDGVDLLIVDEAGQALPHMAAASFSVAKKALLVGDIYQIEPVRTLPEGVDLANLKSCCLADEHSYTEFWKPSSLTSSKGNLMQVAHRQSSVHQLSDLEQGLYLTEHRRCYDSIIRFCNRLVYKNHLKALKGDPAEEKALPMMGFVAHESVSSKQGQSRENKQEAKYIVSWIKSNQQALNTYGEITKSTVVITPFASQANRIKSELKKSGLGGISVGTVHTFQGAEAEVVLFSSVYGATDLSSGKLYDRGSNMLNVAVSRAKQSFIAFGHKDVFGKGSTSTPSALLRSFCQDVKAPTDIDAHDNKVVLT